MFILSKFFFVKYSKSIGIFLFSSFCLQNCNLHIEESKMKSVIEIDNLQFQYIEESIPDHDKFIKRNTKRKIKQVSNENFNTINKKTINNNSNIDTINVSHETIVDNFNDNDIEEVENSKIKKEKSIEVKSPSFCKKGSLILMAGAIIGAGVTFLVLYLNDLTKINQVEQGGNYYQSEFNKCNTYLSGNISAYNTLNSSLVTCNSNIVSCTNNLNNVNTNLAVCNGNLASSNISNNNCISNLATCTTSLNNTNSDLTICNGNLATLNTTENTCINNLATCTTTLNSINSDLTICNGNLASLNTTNTTCTTNLATCANSLNTTNYDLTTCTTNLNSTANDLGACIVNLNAMNASLANYTATPPSLLCSSLSNSFMFNGIAFTQTPGVSCGNCTNSTCSTCKSPSSLFTFKDCSNCTSTFCADTCNIGVDFYQCSICNVNSQ